SNRRFQISLGQPTVIVIDCEWPIEFSPQSPELIIAEHSLAPALIASFLQTRRGIELGAILFHRPVHDSVEELHDAIRFDGTGVSHYLVPDLAHVLAFDVD